MTPPPAAFAKGCGKLTFAPYKPLYLKTNGGRQVIDRFDSALWKVDSARKHADDLEMEIRAF